MGITRSTLHTPALYCYIIILLAIGLWPFNFWQKNNADLDSLYGLIISPPGTVYTPVPPAKIATIEKFTILLHLSSDFAGSNGYGRILTYSRDEKHMNFMIGQWKKSLVFKVHTDAKAKPIHFETDAVFNAGERTWIALVYDGTRLHLYQNGIRKGAKRTGPLVFSQWDTSFPLVIGSDAHGRFHWKGKISTLAIFDRSFPQRKIRDVTRSIGDYAPLVHYTFKKASGTRVKDEGTGTSGNLMVPFRYRPYKRVVLGSPSTAFNDYRRDLRDILLNLAGFIPFGLLMMLSLTRRGIKTGTALFISLAAGFGLSLVIEMIQPFLSSRTSSTTDLINNTLGTTLGALGYAVTRSRSAFLRNYNIRQR